MSTTIAVTNAGLRGFALSQFGTIAADPTVTKTKVIKEVIADVLVKNFDNVAKFGVLVTENGVARPGSVVVTTTATLLATEHVAVVDMTATFTLTLPILSSVEIGHSIFVFLRSAAAGTLTVDADGAETINGVANATMTAAGEIIRLKKESTTNWVTATV